MRKFLQTTFSLSSILIVATGLSACGGGGGGGSSPSPSPTPTSSPTGTPSPTPTATPSATVEISGRVTYDFVPHLNSQNASLNYQAVSVLPVRNASLQLTDANNNPLAWGRTDENGDYTIIVGENEMVKVQILAELNSDTGANYNIKVTDNVNENALYIMEGELASSGTTDSTRSLHAPSGWTGDGYGQTRVAAPFAILDSVWQALQPLLETQPNVQLPPFELRWSPQNIPLDGDPAAGEIITSYFDGTNIYLLGHEDDDTDEYDRSVVQHELAHYLNDKLSRDDSMGGYHDGLSPYDIRLAYSEGSANAFTALVSNSGYYQDSYGVQQSNGSRFDLEENNLSQTGAYNEDTIGQLVYDFFDESNEDNDALSLPLGQFFDTLMHPDYTEAVAFSSIYLFTDVLKNSLNPSQQDAIDTLLEAHEIFGTGIYGEDESNADIFGTLALPFYRELSVGATVPVCMDSQLMNNSSNEYNNYNGITVRRFVRFSIDTRGLYTLSAEKFSGERDTSPQMYLYDESRPALQAFTQSALNKVSGPVSLDTGDYILEIFDGKMIDVSENPNRNLEQVCFYISLST
ncbi:hypothetical protein TDB9533_03214 [Thalassocella blandensis]|nr:hypothetical protein TDB9533_03214 [Thalassocella blandensis]